MSFMENLPAHADPVRQHADDAKADHDGAAIDVDRQIWGDEGSDHDFLSGAGADGSTVAPGNPAMRQTEAGEIAPAPKLSATYEDQTHQDGLSYLLDRRAKRAMQRKAPSPIASTDMTDVLVFQSAQPSYGYSIPVSVPETRQTTREAPAAAAPAKPTGGAFYLRKGLRVAGRVAG